MPVVKISNRQEITRKNNVVQGGKLLIDQTIENVPERVNRTHYTKPAPSLIPN